MTTALMGYSLHSDPETLSRGDEAEDVPGTGIATGTASRIESFQPWRLGFSFTRSLVPIN